jgi:hypothetical protein
VRSRDATCTQTVMCAAAANVNIPDILYTHVFADLLIKEVVRVWYSLAFFVQSGSRCGAITVADVFVDFQVQLFDFAALVAAISIRGGIAY